jgi:serine/threonine protein kinase
MIRLKQFFKKENIQTLLEKARANDADAQYRLATIYAQGELGVIVDKEAARLWYKRAAELHHSAAQLELALMYYNDYNLIEALKYFEPAAIEGNQQAQLILASVYAKEDSEGFNAEKAFYWCEQLAKQGHVNSQFELAKKYEKGIGCNADIKRALEWYAQARQGKHPQASTRYQKLEQVLWKSSQSLSTTMPASSRSPLLAGPRALSRTTPSITRGRSLVDNQGSLVVNCLIKSSELQEGQKIGGGGSGIVLEGSWLGQKVAIKKLLMLELIGDDEYTLQEFQREASIMAGLRHPNIIMFYGVCIEPKYKCIVMEFMEYGSLKKVLTNQDITLIWPHKIKIAIDIIEGVKFLHEKDIFHRDLKSLNVLMKKEKEIFTAKLTDFGLSKLDATDSTMTTKIGGTVTHMAPELFSGMRQFTAKADIYSYAIILWELATRQTPYKGYDQFDIMRMLDNAQRLAIPDETLPSFATLITRCWAQRKGDRPDASEAAYAIRQISKELSQPQHEPVQEISQAM